MLGMTRLLGSVATQLDGEGPLATRTPCIGPVEACLKRDASLHEAARVPERLAPTEYREGGGGAVEERLLPVEDREGHPAGVRRRRVLHADHLRRRVRVCVEIRVRRNAALECL